ncbi:MAG: WG repeat-containing protein, partial [Cyclobacteriaceae bacterium]|nr:WG repeat-containing protein [Cyclobacteriaceae bacterium HetDA_MAG_MS6]
MTYCVHASQEIEVFHHDDRQGIRNKEGQVLIPPVYDQLGWSTGDFLTINELIGYRENGLWGLINLSNRRISEPIYYHLSPHNDEKILAAIKGRFSNQLFYGILDEKGNVKISCNYFSIEPIADQYLVSKYENGRVVQGTINSEYNVVIPTQYIAIQDLSPTILACQRQDFKWEFADENGRLLHDLRVDGFSRWHEYIQLENRGVFGLMSSDGDLLHPVSFKGFSYEGSQPEPVPFPKWVLLDDNLKETKAVEGDSVKEEGKSFMYFKNGETYYLQDISEGVNLDQVEVLDAQKGFFITKNKNTNRWQARKTSGELILDDRDSIYFDGLYFRGEKDGGWIVHNRFGRRISKRRYEAVGLTMSSMVPVKLNNYWGLMDFQGELQVKHKFEGITTGKEDLFVVRY